MKNFKNQQTELTDIKDGKEVSLTFVDLAKITLNVPPKEGWLLDEMKMRFKLEDKLVNTEVGETLQLDDADVEKLLQCAKIPWRAKHRDIIRYVEYLEELVKE